jgi:hypothetical protein
MTDYETIARQKLSLAVDNTHHRQIPLPQPWYERPLYMLALVAAVLMATWFYAAVMFSLERL